jgi:hypothetical protein
MPRYTKKRSFRKRRFSRNTRGKRTTLRKTIKRVLWKNTETKYYDVSDENVQLYHNAGRSGGAALGSIYSDSTFFNPWSDIPAGTGRANRIGDKIRPINMSIRLWLANKLDRPNVMYRIIICKVPKTVNNTVVNSNNIYPFQLSQLGACGNTMLLPLDSDRGFKAYYDKTFNVNTGNSSAIVSGAAVGKQSHKKISITLSRKSQSLVTYDTATQNITNNPLLMYILPYDSYGTLVTDNIASCAYSMRMRYKDM